MKPRVPFGSSLRARVMIGVLVPLIVVMGLDAYVQFVSDRSLMLENLEQVSLSVGDGVEASLARAMLSRDRAELSQVAQDVGGRTTIRNLMILDTQGYVRIASNSSEVGSQIPLSDPTCQVCHQSTVDGSGKSVVLTLADGSHVFRNLTPIRNAAACQTCHGSTAKVNGILAIDLPYDSVDARLWGDLRQNILLALMAIGLVGVAINLLLSRIVVAKLERFGDALMKFARGDFSARVPVEGPDEIGGLASTLNAMAQGLGEKAQLEKEVERTANELELKSNRLGALYSLALESSRSLDLAQVMRVGLENALAVMGMDAGEIHLVEAPAKNLQLRATVRTPGEFAREEDRIGQGECLCGSVAGLGQTRAVGDLVADPGVTRLACKRQGYCSVAAIPLKARGRTLGVLTLHARMPRKFTDDELALLSAMGEQLGVAVDNALLYADMETRVHELSGQVQHLAVLEERVRLGREMHDGFAQAISLLNMKLRTAQLSGNGHISGLLAEMREIVDATYEDVRQAIGDLRMPLTTDSGIVTTLSDYIQNFALRYGLKAQITVSPEAATAPCSPDVQIQVIRIVQEALANVRKHAQAEHLEVRFDRMDGCLEILVRDDGKGFPANVPFSGPGHFGLSIMRERAGSCKGKLDVYSRPDEGTTVTLSVPVDGG